MTEQKIIYVCGTDYMHEIGETVVKTFSSPEKLMAEHKCTPSCGIAKLKVEFVEWVKKPDLEQLEREIQFVKEFNEHFVSSVPGTEFVFHDDDTPGEVGVLEYRSDEEAVILDDHDLYLFNISGLETADKEG